MITLYSTGCPRCNVLTKKLNEKGIAFVENNDEQKMIDLGFTQVPILEVDGKYLNFKEAVDWVNAQKRQAQ